MTPDQFCYWLQGYFELRQNKSATIDSDQVKVIMDHLALVFTKVTPPAFQNAGNIDAPKKEESARDIYDRYIRNKPADAWPPRGMPYELGDPGEIKVTC